MIIIDYMDYFDVTDEWRKDPLLKIVNDRMCMTADTMGSMLDGIRYALLGIKYIRLGYITEKLSVTDTEYYNPGDLEEDKAWLERLEKTIMAMPICELE